MIDLTSRSGRRRASPTPSTSRRSCARAGMTEVREGRTSVRAALTYPAVSNYLAVGCDALALVERLELLFGEERPGRLVDCLRPGDVLRARDVTRFLRLLLRQVRRRQQLAAVLLRRADVDEAGIGISDHLLIVRLAN